VVVMAVVVVAVVVVAIGRVGVLAVLSVVVVRVVGVAIVHDALRAAWSVDELVLPGVQVVAQIERELLWTQDLAGLVGWAVIAAAAALRARVKVEDRLPREVLDAGYPYGRGFLRRSAVGRGLTFVPFGSLHHHLTDRLRAAGDERQAAARAEVAREDIRD